MKTRRASKRVAERELAESPVEKKRANVEPEWVQPGLIARFGTGRYLIPKGQTFNTVRPLPKKFKDADPAEVTRCTEVATALAAARDRRDDVIALLHRISDKTLFGMLALKTSIPRPGPEHGEFHILYEIFRSRDTATIDRALSMVDITCYCPCWKYRFFSSASPDDPTRNMITTAVLGLQDMELFDYIVERCGFRMFFNIGNDTMAEFMDVMWKPLKSSIEKATGDSLPYLPSFVLHVMSTLFHKCVAENPDTALGIFEFLPLEAWVKPAKACGTYAGGRAPGVYEKAFGLIDELKAAHERVVNFRLASLPQGTL